MKKPLYKRWSFWLIAILVVGILGNFLPSNDEAEAPKSESTEKPVAAEVNKSDDKIENETDKQSEPVEEKPATIKSVIADAIGKENYVSHELDAGTLYMTLELSDNWTTNMVVLSAYDQLLEISESLRSQSLVDENTTLHYIFQTDLVDSYGNTSKGNVIIVNLSAETLAKINFDNVRSESIPDIADIHFVHPSLQ